MDGNRESPAACLGDASPARGERERGEERGDLPRRLAFLPDPPPSSEASDARNLALALRMRSRTLACSTGTST